MQNNNKIKCLVSLVSYNRLLQHMTASVNRSKPSSLRSSNNNYVLSQCFASAAEYSNPVSCRFRNNNTDGRSNLVRLGQLQPAIHNFKIKAEVSQTHQKKRLQPPLSTEALCCLSRLFMDVKRFDGSKHWVSSATTIEPRMFPHSSRLNSVRAGISFYQDGWWSTLLILNQFNQQTETWKFVTHHSQTSASSEYLQSTTTRSIRFLPPSKFQLNVEIQALQVSF